MTTTTSRSPLLVELKGGIWYQRVKSQSHAWPGYRPVSFIIPHCEPFRSCACASPGK